jgi:hypothetical protein
MLTLLFSSNALIPYGNAFVVLLHSQQQRRRWVASCSSSASLASSIRRPPPFNKRTALQAVIGKEEEQDGTVALRDVDDDNAALAAILRERTEHSFLLEQQPPKPSSLRQAINYLQARPDMSITRQNWQFLFDAIESATSNESAQMRTLANQVAPQQQPITFPTKSPARTDMTDLYTLLQQRGDLRIFGAAAEGRVPARANAPGDVVTVSSQLWKQATGLPVTALTPSASGGNAVAIAGVALAGIEAIASIYTGIPLNIFFLSTVVAILLDRILLNGGLLETLVQKIAPSTLSTIIRHEAGHFLIAYLLGCPVEGVVLSAFAALKDARFAKPTTAGTSFFDAELSHQLNTAAAAAAMVSSSSSSTTGSKANGNNNSNNVKTITRSAIDRYSITVMAGIAAEANCNQQANGGASDEQALIQFLSNVTGGPWNKSFAAIQNQARYGALQAILLLRQYTAAYDALVATLEAGESSLADCIWAIEQAARKYELPSTTTPVGYIVRNNDNGTGEAFEWKTAGQMKLELEVKKVEVVDRRKKEAEVVPTLSDDEMLRVLSEQRKRAESQLQEIEAKLRQAAEDGANAKLL